MDCEYCAGTITKRKPFPIVSLGRRTRLGHHPTGPELAFCLRACAIRALTDVLPVFFDRVPKGKHLPS